jgi:hypothetical protein
MVFLTPQHYFSYIVAVGFIDGGSRSAWRKNTDLPQVIDKLDHINKQQFLFCPS